MSYRMIQSASPEPPILLSKRGLVNFLQMRKEFTLYAIYSLADQWDDPQRFDVNRLPFDIAEGVRIEDVSQFIRDDTFKFMEKKRGTDEVEALQRTRYALVHRF